MIQKTWLPIVVAGLLSLAATCDIPIPTPTEPSTPYDCDNPAAATGVLAVKGAIKDQYVVRLKPPTEGLRTLATIEALASRLGAKDVRTFTRAFSGFAAKLDSKALAKISADPSVLYVSQVGTKRINVGWNLDILDSESYDDKYEPGATGEGIDIAIIDTGVDLTNAEFAGRAGECWAASGLSDCKDAHGHGSHVAGSAAGATYGVAKKATIHGLRVLDAQGSGTDTQVIEGIEEAIRLHAERNRPMVANMSLGGSDSQPLNDAVCRAIKAGIHFALAAGNDGVDACGNSPGRVKQAITAGAVDKTMTAATWSNHGTCVDLYAPGVDVRSIGGLMSGTSMASPHACGALALATQRHPDQSPEQWLVDHVRSGVLTGADPNKMLSVEE